MLTNRWKRCETRTAPTTVPLVAAAMTGGAAMQPPSLIHFIILNAKLIVFNTQFLVLNTNSSLLTVVNVHQ